MGTDNPANQLDNADDQHIQPSHASQDSGNRLRHALANLGLFFEAARERDPIPSLQEIAGDLLQTDDLEIAIPAGAGPVQYDDAQTLALPITFGGRPIGRLRMQRKQAFDAEDRTIAFMISQIISVVLEQSSLHGQIEQYHQQARANADTLEQLLIFKRQIVGGVTDPLHVALLLATQVPEMVGGDRASLLIVPEDQPDVPQLVLSNGTIASLERAREVRDTGLAGLVFRERRPLIIDETETDQRWLSMSLKSFEAPSRCAMAVPVVWADQVLGVLTVTTTQSRLFDPSHLNLLELVAHNVSLVLHSATLNERLGKLMRLLAEAMHDLHAPLQSTHQTLQQLLPEGPDVSADTRIAVTVGDLRTLAAALSRISSTTEQIQRAYDELLTLQQTVAATHLPGETTPDTPNPEG
jgi:transcriptional regulator with GAF, ATPase, and Fis domain